MAVIFSVSRSTGSCIISLSIASCLRMRSSMVSSRGIATFYQRLGLRARSQCTE